MKKILHFLKNKRGPIAVFTTALIGVLAGYVMSHPFDFGFCPGNIETNGMHTWCSSVVPRELGFPTLSLSLGLFTTSLILFFVRKEVFHAWLLPAVIVGALSLFIVFNTPSSSPGYISYNRPEYATFFSYLFFIISLCIILWKSFRISKK